MLFHAAKLSKAGVAKVPVRLYKFVNERNNDFVCDCLVASDRTRAVFWRRGDF